MSSKVKSPETVLEQVPYSTYYKRKLTRSRCPAGGGVRREQRGGAARARGPGAVLPRRARHRARLPHAAATRRHAAAGDKQHSLYTMSSLYILKV